MKNMYAVVFLLVVASTSSILCFTSNNDVDDQDIFMVVDDEQTTTMHDAGLRANPVEIGTFLLEDGKVLKLSRKSSPSRNCAGHKPGDYCAWDTWCCGGLLCNREIGKCGLYPGCVSLGSECALLGDSCCWPHSCSGTTRGSVCE